MVFLLWLAILPCQLLSLLHSSSACASCLLLSRTDSFSLSLRFSSFTTLRFLSLSIPLLFSVFPLIRQLLTASLSLFLLVSICTFPVCRLSLRFPFLPPPVHWSILSHSERSFPTERGAITNTEFCCAAVHFQFRTKCAYTSVFVCVFSVSQSETDSVI